MIKTTTVILATTILFASSALAQVQPQGGSVITAQEAADLFSAIMALERGDCHGVPPPRPGMPDERKCDPFKLGALYGPLTVDLVHVQDIIKSFQSADGDLRKEIFGEHPTPPKPDATAANKDAWQKKNDDYASRQTEMMKQPHAIVLERFKFADLHVGDPPERNAVPLDALSELSKTIMTGLDEPPAPTADAAQPKKP